MRKKNNSTYRSKRASSRNRYERQKEVLNKKGNRSTETPVNQNHQTNKLVAISVGVVILFLLVIGGLTINHLINRKPKVNMYLIGCTTGVDLVRGMGEISHAYVTLDNVGQVDVSNLVVTLNASDEELFSHPDKSKSIAHLPIDHQVSIQLTTNTVFGQNTAIEVTATSDEGLKQNVTRSDCREIVK